MKRLTFLLAFLTGQAVHAADLLAETAAWSPLPGDQEEIIPAENLPLRQVVSAWYIQSLLVAATSKRLNGLAVVERDRVPADAQVTVGQATGDHGFANFDIFEPSCGRTSLYGRIATDSLAKDAGKALIACGAGAMGSIGGGPTGIWGEVGWSDERGWFGRAEADLLLAHVIVEGDDETWTTRTGLSFRWPGGTLARSPQDDPWSFAACLDYARTKQDDIQVNGALFEISATWRFFNHWLATGQIQAASSSIEDAREANGLVTAAVGIGYIW
jgi:hypothetical protein